MNRDDERRKSGEGSVTWDASVGLWIGRLPRDERGRRPKVSGKTRREAERKLERKLAEREQGIVGAGRMTVRQFLQQWARDTLSVSGLDPRTIENYERLVRLHLVPGLGRIRLANLTPMHVQQFVREELAAGKGPTTVQKSLMVLRRSLKQAVLWGLVPRNVAKLVDGVTVKAAEKRPFTTAEQAAILDAAKGDRLYVMVVLAHATGLRQSELLGIRWCDVDLEGRLLLLSKQLGRDGQLRDPKSEAGKRVLPLPEFTVAALRVHRKAQERERADAAGWHDLDLVITTKTGRPVSHRNAHRSWTRILKNAGVGHRGIHHMRHAYGTSLAEIGVHERVAQYLLGHADSRVTKEIYQHVTGSMLDSAASAIDQAVADVVTGARGSRNGSSVSETSDRAVEK
jgi:integrase